MLDHWDNKRINFWNDIFAYWKVNLIPKFKLFALKPIRSRICTRKNIRKIKLDINGYCSFCE